MNYTKIQINMIKALSKNRYTNRVGINCTTDYCYMTYNAISVFKVPELYRVIDSRRLNNLNLLIKMFQEFEGTTVPEVSYLDETTVALSDKFSLDTKLLKEVDIKLTDYEIEVSNKGLVGFRNDEGDLVAVICAKRR